MAITIFYSWQSDRDQKTNRFLVRDALSKALGILNEDLSVSEADRATDADRLSLDHDTKDVPGTPDIVGAILEKIDRCGIFVADLTFVAQSSKGDGLPNPNVLTERGYALKSISSRRLVAVMNTAYGQPDQLPFDFRHARFPIQFHLDASADSTQRNSQRDALSAQLAEAIRTILKSGALEGLTPKPAPFIRTDSTTAPSVFFGENEPLTTIEGYGRAGTKPVMPIGPKFYLRLIPTYETEPLSSAEVYEIVRGPSRVGPMSMRHSDGYFDGRNKYGAIDILLDTQTNTILSATQIFRNKEIWGIDRTLLKDGTEIGSEVSYLPSIAIERVYKSALARYLKTAKERLGLRTPLVMIAGATGVEGFRMAVQNHFDQFSPPMVLSNIELSAEINSYDQDPSTILLPFFRRLWEECGLQRPDGLA